MTAFGVPKAFVSRWMKPAESAIAVVEGEDSAEGDRLRPVPLGDPAHRGGGQIQRLVPADPLPAGIGIALRPGAPQRMGQPLGVIDQLRRGAALGAERLAGRVRGIGIEPREAAVLDHRDAAAACDAEPAIAVNAACAAGICHGLLSCRRNCIGSLHQAPVSK